MELLIDGSRCDLPAGWSCAVPGYDASRNASPEACREGRSLRVKIPATDGNDRLLGFASDPHSAERFNASLHRTEVRAEEAVLLAGTVRLLGCDGDAYDLEIRDGGARWAEQAARRRLHQTQVEYAGVLTPEAIVGGWRDDSPVKFFPVVRDEYPRRNASQDLMPAERLLSVDDYHPFLHLASVLEAIFAEAGYAMQSRFLHSEFFRSLYMSGAYARHDTTTLFARMGFVAGRRTAASAEADTSGRVYADPAARYHSVGDIVETAAPQAADDGGEPLDGLCNNGSCFGTEQGRIRYRPLADIAAGFEYRLRYTTDHRILTRTQLRGFDSVYLGPGARTEFRLANRYEDRKKAPAAGTTYLAMVFGAAQESSHRLVCTQADGTQIRLGPFAGRAAKVALPAGSAPAAIRLERLESGTWRPCAEDWALYDGHLEERGRTTVEMTLCTPAALCSPDTPATFDRIFFYGAEPGMTLTLEKECRLQPLFRSGPCLGASLAFGDVARGDIRQIEVAEAAAHLFNLRFYTDTARRRVFIEPEEEFHASGSEVDWSDRTDFSHPVLRTATAPEIHERRTWRYRTGEGAAARLERAEGKPFGAWSYESPTFAAMQGEQERVNPLFGATLQQAGTYANAPAALLPSVGDRDQGGTEEQGFATRILRYAGMHPLPAGQRWGYPADEGSYPLAAFHFAGDAHTEGFTLCFDDREGIRGLHRYYDRQVRREALRERITLWLRIEPHEFAALLSPGSAEADIRSRFRIDTGAGVVRATLHRLESYDPAAASVCCTFNRLIED